MSITFNGAKGKDIYLIGEVLLYVRECGNREDHYAVVIKIDGSIVGHVPLAISNIHTVAYPQWENIMVAPYWQLLIVFVWMFEGYQ